MWFDEVLRDLLMLQRSNVELKEGSLFSCSCSSECLRSRPEQFKFPKSSTNVPGGDGDAASWRGCVFERIHLTDYLPCRCSLPLCLYQLNGFSEANKAIVEGKFVFGLLNRSSSIYSRVYFSSKFGLLNLVLVNCSPTLYINK